MSIRNNKIEGQLTWDMLGETPDNINKLQVVTATFTDSVKTEWKSLFSGYNELYAITFSSGIGFIEKVLEMFEYAEIIFGNEQVIGDTLAAVIALQTESIKQLAKSPKAEYIAGRMDDKTLSLFVGIKFKKKRFRW